MAYTGTAQAAVDGMIDLRSDTVTKPTKAMRAAMAQAEVGDDVFGDDPSVNQLQERVAQMLGKEAALLVPTGTQSNLTAMLSHCSRGEEYIAGRDYHVYSNEAGGAAVLGSISPCTIPNDHQGRIEIADIVSAIKPDDAHCPISRLLCLENTVSGCVQDQDHLNACAATGREFGLAVHLDGARLMNAAIQQQRPVAELTAAMDSVSLCLSKGLGTPLGSVLAGSEEFIKRAKRWRKMLGGGMRQAGIVAAAGLHALDHHIERLAEDHANAQMLAHELAQLPGMICDPAQTQTNMVFVTPPAGTHAALRSHLWSDGIIAIGDRGPMRLVTHLGISTIDITRIVDSFARFDGKSMANVAA